MTITIPSQAAGGDTAALVQALTESRERWRALACLGADFGFETDKDGRLALLAPAVVLGWPAERLIGTDAEALLVPDASPAAGTDAGATGLFNPFRTRLALQRRRVWLRAADGTPACLLMSVEPIAGTPGAVRGMGIDMTGQERQEARLAATLLRYELSRTMTRRMRQVALPFASLRIALEELIGSTDGDGATIVLHDPGAPVRVAAKAGQPWPGSTRALHDAVLNGCGQPAVWLGEAVHQYAVEGQSLLLCSSTNHFIDRTILAIWRTERRWNEDEAALVADMLPVMQPILEHEQIQRETALLSRTDILTGLYNRQGFAAELLRRLERLDREGLPGTLMVVGMDGLGTLNASDGLECGDIALRDTARILRDTVRPTDLVSRLGGDLFALWLDGADQFAAAERADGLRRTGIQLGNADGPDDRERPPGTHGAKKAMPARRITVSIGLAVRSSRSFESIDSLLHRAWSAMHAIKQGGGGRWQVSAEEPTP